jgi:glutamine synthetase
MRRTLARLAQAGLSARAAPEMEFYLFARRPGGAAHELQAPRPAPGSPAWESACEADSIERAACFGAYFDELFAACERWSIPVTGYSHESALSQYEVNFTPGEPLAQADAVFRFKRLARHVAARHGFLASFLAKPFLDQPGAGTHWHFSLQDRQGNNAFLAADGQSEAPALDAFMAGVQAHAPAAMAFLAPYDNSYDRLHHADSSPSRATCGRDDRNAAFRVPRSSPANRRVENRLPGGDASPYLTAALTLGLGLEGMNRGGQPVPAPGIALPRTLSEALDALDGDRVVRQLLGDPLVELYLAIKRTESAQRMRCKHPREDWDLLVLPEQA